MLELLCTTKHWWEKPSANLADDSQSTNVCSQPTLIEHTSQVHLHYIEMLQYPFVETQASCELYHNSVNAVCYEYGSIGRDYVFIDNSANVDDLNSIMRNFLNTLRAIENDRSRSYPNGCIDRIFELMCHNIFPLCDYRSDTPGSRQVLNAVGVCSSYIYIILL